MTYMSDSQWVSHTSAVQCSPELSVDKHVCSNHCSQLVIAICFVTSM